MGNPQSKTKTGDHVAQAIYFKSNDNLVQFVDVKPDEILKFKPSHTKFIAYTAPYCKSKNFDELKYIDQDAYRVKEALCMTGVVQEEECHLFPPKSCTFEGIRKRFIEHAGEASRASNTNETENEELLIFFFSGHGILNDCNEFLGLVPVDYDGTEKLCIKSEDLLEWLQGSGCTANVLFMIDACYSGGFHKSSSPSDSPDLSQDSSARKVYVMYSCGEKQESFEHSIVQHSIFSYCLSRAIIANAAKEGPLADGLICDSGSEATDDEVIGEGRHFPPHTHRGILLGFSTGLPIKDIEETYKCLTYAVCLLLNMEQQHPGLTKFLMEMKTPTGAKASEGMSLEQELSLDQGCLDWIKKFQDKGKPLDTLKKEGYLKKQEVVDVVLCVMMRYIVCYHVHYYDSKRIKNPNFFENICNALSEYTELKFGEREKELMKKEFDDCRKKHIEELLTLVSGLSLEN